MLKIGIVCYPTYGGSGVLATELGKALAKEGHHVHFITYKEPARLDAFNPRIFYHEVMTVLTHTTVLEQRHSVINPVFTALAEIIDQKSLRNIFYNFFNNENDTVSILSKY